VTGAREECTTILVRWMPPPVIWVKLNTDGSCRDDGRIGCGGVLRGSDSEWLC
jgi:hypothetical protein